MGDTVATIPVSQNDNVRPRLWLGVLIVALQWLAIKGPRWLELNVFMQFMAMFWVPMVGAVAVVLWWLFGSRRRWPDRWFVLAAFVLTGAGAYAVYDKSVGGFGLIMNALPAVTTAWVLWIAATERLSWTVRRSGLLVVFLLAFGYFAMLRLDGIDGSMTAAMSYRWTSTAEDQYVRAGFRPVAERVQTDDTLPSVSILRPSDWPAFRGPQRDGRRTGVRLTTDWDSKPPRFVWRQRIGPGWSSFAVVGNLVYTQEQRGPDEAVVCYLADSGQVYWVHQDSARFTEVVAGPGPRATPTFQDGRLYTLGAAGRLNCLDAGTGNCLWSRDIVADSGAKVPIWGFSSSPLVCHDLVIVFAGAKGGKSVLAYKIADGTPAWTAGEGELSYCSPELAVVGGVEQVLISTDAGATSFDPPTGQVLWHHSWQVKDLPRIVQPAVLNDTDVLIGSGLTAGTRRLRVTHGGDGWDVQEVWTTKAINPYFNDFVIDTGHLYGFDGKYFTCVNLEDGKKTWRERGYGNGQVLLVADQHLLLVLSETGEVALVEAAPDARRELTRFQALEGKTWNHPVIANGKLFVRNGEEMACFELTAP